jgi:BlaI family penicillinase repressor
MKTIPQISEAELEVMKILWACSSATSAQIIEQLSDKTDWKPKTVQTLIMRLTAKEAIRAEKTSGKAFVYAPQVGEEEYKAHANQSFLQKLYNGSLNLMLTSFIKEKRFSREELQELKKLLEEEL